MERQAWVYTSTPRSRWTGNVSAPCIYIMASEPSKSRDYMTWCDLPGHEDSGPMPVHEARREAVKRRESLEKELRQAVNIYEEPCLSPPPPEWVHEGYRRHCGGLGREVTMTALDVDKWGEEGRYTVCIGYEVQAAYKNPYYTRSSAEAYARMDAEVREARSRGRREAEANG